MATSGEDGVGEASGSCKTSRVASSLLTSHWFHGAGNNSGDV
jgi:hypothetical protein